MNTSIGLGDRYTLNPMCTPFILQSTIRTPALHDKGHVSNTALWRFIDIQDFNLPAPIISVATIHAEEFSSEKRGFISTSTCLDSHNRVFLIHDIFRQQGYLYLLKQLLFVTLQALDFLEGEFAHLRIVTIVHFLSFGNLLIVSTEIIVFLDVLLDFRVLTSIALY